MAQEEPQHIRIIRRQYDILMREGHALFSVEPRRRTDLAKGQVIDWQNWDVVIFGPVETPYEYGVFTLVINFPDTYPFMPPNIVFKTAIYHPNIGIGGAICLDVLKDKWSPALTIEKTLLSILDLMSSPNPDDPLNREAGIMLKTDPERFRVIARQLTSEVA